MNNEINVKYKDGVFRYLFKEKDNFVRLYEEIANKKLNAEDIELQDTNSIVMSKDLKNDLSFVTKDNRFIILVEHQSTRNPNMPLRMLMYYNELLHMYIKQNKLNIFGPRPIEYPAAEFYVAYNGVKDWEEDYLEVSAGDVGIGVKLIDIHYDHLRDHDPDNALAGYAYLVKQKEQYQREGNLLAIEAIDKAIEDCKKAGYLRNYLERREFLTMVSSVWTVEQQLMDERAYGVESGRQEGRQEGRQVEKMEIAAKALQNGFTVEQAVLLTGLSKSQIEELKKEIH